MSNSNQNGTASLSKSQRREFQQFKKRNSKKLAGVPVTTQVQIWRDGFIVGAIHGFDQGMDHAKKRNLRLIDAQFRRLKAKKVYHGR